MPEERFDIVFAGELIEGADPAEARKWVRQIFKASDTQLERLFSGKPVTVKKSVGMEAAGKYRLAFRKAGALVRIRPGSALPDKEPSEQPDDWQLLPPNSGSLDQFAPKLKPAPLPDISGMATSAPGTTLDETPEPPPARIGISALDLTEGEWSLEDCQPPPLSQVEPNIDGLDFAPPDDTSHIPPEPPPEPLPDISTMTLEEPEEEEDTNSAVS